METVARCVMSCSALYCATTALSTSLPMEGSTRSAEEECTVIKKNPRPNLLERNSKRWVEQTQKLKKDPTPHAEHLAQADGGEHALCGGRI